MELKEFTNILKEQYYDASEIVFDDDTDIRSIESFDSLTGMAMLLEIKDNFQIDIDEKIWRDLHTPREMYNFICSQK